MDMGHYWYAKKLLVCNPDKINYEDVFNLYRNKKGNTKNEQLHPHLIIKLSPVIPKQ